MRLGPALAVAQSERAAIVAVATGWGLRKWRWLASSYIRRELRCPVLMRTRMSCSQTGDKQQEQPKSADPTPPTSPFHQPNLAEAQQRQSCSRDPAGSTRS